MSEFRIEFIGIDLQNDFCLPDGALSVPNGTLHCENIATMIERLGKKINAMHLTMDSHQQVDISHPLWWVDKKGNHPGAYDFTIISSKDVEDGIWTTTKPGMFQRSLDYLRALEATNRYPHCIWPDHCLIGSSGHNIQSTLHNAVKEWEIKTFSMTDYVTKGSNPWTEHFSAVRAEVPDPSDPSTHLNTRFVEISDRADMILLAGEARSHCLAATVRDFVDAFSDPKYANKLYLLTDATGDVQGFEHLGESFVRDMTAKGMNLTTTEQFLR